MSNNLDIDQMVPAQDQKETTHNDANGQIDAALTDIVGILIDDSNAYTFTDDEYLRHFRFAIIADTPAPDADVTITVPSNKRGLFIVSNGLDQVVGVEINGQAGDTPMISASGKALLESDGTNVRNVVSGPSEGVEVMCEYLYSPHLAGTPGSSALVARFIAARPATLPIALAMSQGHAGVAATAQTDFDLQLNSGSVGTIRFAASGTVATFIKASASAIVAGDVIDIIAPGSTDATLADITFTLVTEC